MRGVESNKPFHALNHLEFSKSVGEIISSPLILCQKIFAGSLEKPVRLIALLQGGGGALDVFFSENLLPLQKSGKNRSKKINNFFYRAGFFR